MTSSSDDDNGWNVSKHRTKSEDKSCLYKQVFNINPLMGGFSVIGDTLDKSTFNVYQFTGEYKVGAGGQNGNNVILTTTQSCSQASVSFVKALVVFQQKITPEKRDTRCKQLVEFNENKYTIVVSPFEQHDIDVGTMITANNGSIFYANFKLPSKTNQAKIAQALFDSLKKPILPFNEFGDETLYISLTPDISKYTNIPQLKLVKYHNDGVKPVLFAYYTDGNGYTTTKIEMVFSGQTSRDYLGYSESPKYVDYLVRFDVPVTIIAYYDVMDNGVKVNIRATSIYTPRNTLNTLNNLTFTITRSGGTPINMIK